MADFYADEHIPNELVDRLRSLGHDVLTARQDGRADRRIEDPLVLSRATQLGRTVLTNNRWDFVRLHKLDSAHTGIVAYTDHDLSEVAARIDAAVRLMPTLAGQLIRIDRANKPPSTSSA